MLDMSASIAARSSGDSEVHGPCASLWIFLTRPLSTVPGPTSTYVVTPSDARRRTTASHRTGADTCRTSASMAARASRFGSRVDVGHDRDRGSATRSARSSGASRSSAGFISAQWNGALTGSGIARLAPERLRALDGALHRGRGAGDHDLSGAVDVGRAHDLALRRLLAGLRAPSRRRARESPPSRPAPTGTASCM